MEILYHPRAVKFINKISNKERHRIIKVIEKLPNTSTFSLLDIKKLVTTQRSYRLRVGNIRIIFELGKDAIYIHDIDFRGNVY